LVAQASPRGVGDRVGAADAVVAPRLTRMSVYLARAQQRMALPWEPAGVPLGGWSLIGGDPDDPASIRDATLSPTRLALEGLGAAATRTAAGATLQEARRQALPYVRALQNRDGGFRFAAVADDPLNKAGLVRSGVAGAGPSSAAADRPADEARSYGSATADGLAALAACDVEPADRAFQAAVAWLDAHPGVDHVPGFEEQAGGPPSARHGLVFYYRASLARAMRLASDARFARQHVPLAESLVAEQRADGSWANASALMREDDPLIATAWALCALSQVRPLVLQQDR
ncbi:MAG TPA: hypothetical protein VEQ85_07125, partial [Lacipirellulaceae bacterium]|nr:hypothetical protein [Lacipirellulaceae bacterium]